MKREPRSLPEWNQRELEELGAARRQTAIRQQVKAVRGGGEK